MSFGKIHRFYAEKGFGFIQGDDGAFFFAHRDRIESGEKSLKKEDRVSFEVLSDTMIALNIRKVD
ncbi:MAG: hypothetical protein Kow0025_09990 [Thermodesulfovibrionales bacterium]